MSNPTDPGLTWRLERLADLSPEEQEDVFRAIYDELRKIADCQMREQQPGHTLQATALVHEAWLKIRSGGSRSLEDRAHFLAIASNAMRQILVDHARAKKSQKRSTNGQRVGLESLCVEYEGRAIDLLTLDELLREFATFAPDDAQIVQLRFFGGLRMSEIARVMNRPLRAVERDWQAAREWLRRRLK